MAPYKLHFSFSTRELEPKGNVILIHKSTSWLSMSALYSYTVICWGFKKKRQQKIVAVQFSNHHFSTKVCTPIILTNLSSSGCWMYKLVACGIIYLFASACSWFAKVNFAFLHVKAAGCIAYSLVQAHFVCVTYLRKSFKIWPTKLQFIITFVFYFSCSFTDFFFCAEIELL